MIDFSKVPEEQMMEIMTIIQKNVERSELEKFYLFSINPVEKAKIFVYCYRFFKTLANLMTPGDLRDIIIAELDKSKEAYECLYFNILWSEKKALYKNRRLSVINNLIIGDKRIDEMVDGFTILMERTTIISLSKVQAFNIEGKFNEEAYSKIFNANIKNLPEKEIEEDFSDEAEETSETETEKETEIEDNPEKDAKIDDFTFNSDDEIAMPKELEDTTGVDAEDNSDN